ncbi:MAG: Fe2+-dependent dioxygenase [Proteobacteria bacterium]|nr:Fe2+-dependent dioxygenase [Pseudomonadota bacterium]
MLTRIDQVLSTDEVATLHAMYANVEPVDGKHTAHGLAAAVKHNQQLPPEHPAVQDGVRLVLEALKRNALFHHCAFPRRAFPPMFSRYEPGMAYGEHVDNAILLTPLQMRTDVAVTLFLSDPASYDGGELVINTGNEERQVKLPAGSLVAYPPYFLHRVAPVTRGVRLAAVTWVESLVRDPEQRRLLHQMDRAMGALHGRHGDSAELMALNNAYHTLMRMWAET